MSELDNKYFKRVIFPSGQQAKFLNKVQVKLGLSSKELSAAIGVHSRTFRDWKRERYSMPLYAVNELCKKTNIIFPKNTEIKEPFWYTFKGAQKGWITVLKKYGRIGGDANYRKKKWYEWLEREGQYRKHPIINTLPFKVPKDSVYLAEVFGIILGDGGITKGQVRITLNRKDDIDFIYYVAGLFKKVFDIDPSLCKDKKCNVINITISRKKVIEFLTSKGLKIGNKVQQQVDVPLWIKESETFVKPCLRGLFDTDGCFYVDKHHYKDKTYFNCGMCFSNRSIPLLIFFKTELEKLGFHPTRNREFSIVLRIEDEIIKYFQEISSSNQKHLNKFKNYFKNRYGEVPKFGHTGAVSKTDGL